MYKNDIGINAGIIWHLLADKGAMSIREIGEHTNYKDSFIFFALGWLARENNILFSEENGAIYVELLNYPIFRNILLKTIEQWQSYQFKI